MDVALGAILGVPEPGLWMQAALYSVVVLVVAAVGVVVAAVVAVVAAVVAVAAVAGVVVEVGGWVVEKTCIVGVHCSGSMP